MPKPLQAPATDCPWWMKTAFVLIVLLNILDAALTWAVVRLKNVYESNPLMAVVLKANPELFLIVKLSLVLLGVALLARYCGLRVVRLSAVLLVVTFGALMLRHLQILWLVSG
ncbi:DUF5658 family protein [Thiorhodococcus minor]|uniref:DUF5658 domain-containing protein n=1 Tax=Thiorhodococcus minor TaxID=57489 RepID=A0A6M0K5V8_9GAMM|nr:DUF5658 family protein [Thiorhodococcus minor]NEV65166.1 hypothetical protein [Thiorhodococcus minor]